MWTISSHDIWRILRFTLLPGLALTLALTVYAWQSAQAQAGVETARVRLYFLLNNQPFHDRATLFISCYGRPVANEPISPELPAGLYLPELVYEGTVDCPQYGCSAALAYFAENKYVEFCEFQAEAQGQRFLVGQSPGFLLKDCAEECPLYLEIPPGVGLTNSPLPLFLRQYLSSDQGRFSQAVLLALLVEIPVVWLLWLLICDRKSASLTRLVGVTGLVTCLAMPLAWYVLPRSLGPATAVLAGMLVAFLVEIVSYRVIVPVRLSQAFTLAFAANIAAFGLYMFMK